MQFILREVEKFMIYMLFDVVFKCKVCGLKFNYLEVVFIIIVIVMEGVRDGKFVEDVMKEVSKVFIKDDVMDGVVDLILNVQVEVIFIDGSCLVMVYDFIK